MLRGGLAERCLESAGGKWRRAGAIGPCDRHLDEAGASRLHQRTMTWMGHSYLTQAGNPTQLGTEPVFLSHRPSQLYCLGWCLIGIVARAGFC